MKYSIKRQITLIFVGIMAATIFACWLLNNLFLKDYYVHHKETDLQNVYHTIVTETMNGDITSKEFELSLQKLSGKYNTGILIINSIMEPIQIYSNEPEEQLLRELRDNLFGVPEAKRVIEKTEEYVLVQKNDKYTQTDYIEMWGVLPNGSFFLMRTALESIKDSVAIANQFLLYVGLATAVISSIIILLLTRRISKPILELAKISEKMTNMDFNAKYTGNEKTEIALLGYNINQLSMTLERTISELKTANVELEHDIERKDKIDEMRKEFLSNVSHELKTPIALIQGYAEGLKEEINDKSERDYYCEVIMDEASKMNNMVKKLLTLNQLEFGSDNITMERFDLSMLVRNYLQSADILTKQNGISVKNHLVEPIYVWSDEFKVEEVFANYFTNAINHCQSDTEKVIDVSMEMTENSVKLIVFNTGQQIPQDSISHLWEKFYKVDKARTREYGGSGVGLSIVKAIMDSLGQSYGVENRENGVAFFFTLDCENE